MTWKRKAVYAVSGLGAVLAIAFVAFWIWRPWVPSVVVADPAPGGTRVTDGGVLANWYPAPGGGRRPTVVLLGGSEGGLGSKSTLPPLRRAGFNVMELAYFRGPGQTAALENVPLETFDRALAWVARQPGVDASRIGLLGVSKGAEAALIVATRHPELRAVVAGAPSSVMWQGVDWSTMFGAGDGASWSLGGKPVPFVPYGELDYNRGPVSIYEESLKTLPADAAAIIPVERARAPLLLVCGGADLLWPSCPMARMVEARAASRGGPPVTVLSYPGAGHGAFGVPRPANDPDIDQLGGMGGTGHTTNAARMDSWPKVMAFLRKELGQ